MLLKNPLFPRKIDACKTFFPIAYSLEPIASIRAIGQIVHNPLSHCIGILSIDAGEFFTTTQSVTTVISRLNSLKDLFAIHNIWLAVKGRSFDETSSKKIAIPDVRIR